MSDIIQKTILQNPNAKFSIIIPTWNNLEMLKLCINSILKNSRFQHQIILHINEGSDNTVDWVSQQSIDYTHSLQNIGVCKAVNAAASLATTDYILYLNDDMYVCPNWDFYLWEAIEQHPNNRFSFSATAIEPIDVCKKIAIAPYSFGRSVVQFDEEKLLSHYNSFQMNDWSGASWPPNIVHKSVWEEVGGYSEEFFPGFYSDPDFSMKLWKAGIRCFRGISKSRVYHFLEVSTNKLKSESVANGRKLFLHKWGITARVFYKYYLHMGKPYKGVLQTPQNLVLFFERLICIFKK